jgi:ParB/RepB/Spo0J family partition protein
MHKDVPLTDIVDNPFQPRTKFNREMIQSLADEIEAEGFWNGTLQGRRNARGQVELVFGHRRLRALRLLKHASVKVELLDLTDAQMALRALEENLQREGLTDFEKADAIKQAVDIEKKGRRAAGQSERGAMEVVAKRLGLTVQWIYALNEISSTLVEEEREEIADLISAKTAFAAKKWGGKRYLKTLLKQGREATKSDSTISKPTEHTVAAMKRAVMAVSEKDRSKLEERVFSGELTTPQEVEQAARRLKAAQVKRGKEAPPDLKVVIMDWTDELQTWNERLTTVLPYMDYIDEEPTVAKKFQAALEKFITTAQQILKASR